MDNREPLIKKNKITINIVINSVKHELSIDPQNERLYREAAKHLDQELLRLRSTMRLKSGLDYISLVAFTLAVEKLEKEERDESALLNEKLTELLNKLE